MSQVTIRYIVDALQTGVLALVGALVVRSGRHNQIEVPPPQGSVTDEVGLRQLSDTVLAKRWVEAMRLGENTTEILAEFNRRAWQRYEDSANDGSSTMSVPPKY